MIMSLLGVFYREPSFMSPWCSPGDWMDLALCCSNSWASGSGLEGIWKLICARSDQKRIDVIVFLKQKKEMDR